MPEMRAPSSPATILFVAAAVLTLVGCVPPPAGRGGSPAAASGGSGAADGSSVAGETPMSSAPTAPVGPTAIPSFVRPTPLPAPTFLAYTVKGGDTLTSIARAYRTTPHSIAFWSRAEHPSLDPESSSYQPDRLTIGWVLLLIPDAVFDEDELMDATPSPAASPAASSDGSPAPTAS